MYYADGFVARQTRRITIALALDAATFAAFALLVGFSGPRIERNPVIAGVYAMAGVWGVIALKAGAAGLMQWRSRRFTPKPVSATWVALYAVASTVAIAGTVIGAAFNTASLLASLGIVPG